MPLSCGYMPSRSDAEGTQYFATACEHERCRASYGVRTVDDWRASRDDYVRDEQRGGRRRAS